MKSFTQFFLVIAIIGITSSRIAAQENQEPVAMQEPLALLEEFDRMNQSIETLKADIITHNNKMGERVLNVEEQITELSSKLEALEKDLAEFKLWVKSNDEKRTERERQMSEGVEIKGTVTYQ